jgi:hypothetical protein
MLPRKLFAAILVYCFVLLSVSLSILYTPACQIAVRLFTHKVHFQFFILSPALAIFLWAVVKTVKENSTIAEEQNAATVLSLVCWYCLYVVLFTGGISGSPLSSLAGIVPLLASSFLGERHRIRLLLFFAAGAFLIGILSTLKVFEPPSVYPIASGWEVTGKANTFIAMIVIATGIFIEVFLLLFKKHHSGATPAVV